MRRHSGFSLVELSIVLVILGLLTGGILAGQSLIRASELRSMVTEVNRYNAAVYAFRDKYFALPGDMRNAVRFWDAQAGGTADGLDTDCQALDFTSPATTKATCNGNGNGVLSWKETWRAWQHLANAGLVEGSYAGVEGNATDVSWGTPGFNMPRSKVENAGYAYFWLGTLSSVANYFDASYGNALLFGRDNGVDEAFIHASEAWNIDTKMDDGRPAHGKVIGPANSMRPNCTTTNDATAEYRFNATVKQCNLYFITGF